MKFKHHILISTGLLLCVFVLLTSFISNKPTLFEQGKEIIVFRKVGHEILLNVGDETSRVLPVRTITQNEFELRFENTFAFKPDSIVKIVNRVFEQHNVNQDYIVNVIECTNEQIVFGYAVIQSNQEEIVPCRDRNLDKNCYFLSIKFNEPAKSFIHRNPVRLGLSTVGILLVIIGTVKSRNSPRPQKENNTINNNGIYKIGQSIFNENEQFISIEGKKTKLTGKEVDILRLFINNKNKVVERKELDQKIWNDDGVIVGRSLDVFISKLRQKLKQDSSIAIVNIYAKGYKLEEKQT
jgi:DNA-binding winged helix-turn-helix (wHTH) protein